MVQTYVEHDIFDRYQNKIVPLEIKISLIIHISPSLIFKI